MTNPTPDTTDVPTKDTRAPARPDGMPPKFWDDATGEVKLGQLLKSYMELEKRMGHVSEGKPDDPAGYQITVDHDLLDVDEGVNRALHEAGFSNEQAQVVYDLAGEHLMPMVEAVSEHYAAQRDKEKLIEHFGGEAAYEETVRQIDAWGQANLSDNVLDALSGTFEGVLALQNMMAKGEPALGAGKDGAIGAMDEGAIRKMMKDPKYWRERDPAVVERVRNGFRRLYPGGTA